MQLFVYIDFRFGIHIGELHVGSGIIAISQRCVLDVSGVFGCMLFGGLAAGLAHFGVLTRIAWRVAFASSVNVCVCVCIVCWCVLCIEVFVLWLLLLLPVAVVSCSCRSCCVLVFYRFGDLGEFGYSR